MDNVVIVASKLNDSARAVAELDGIKKMKP